MSDQYDYRKIEKKWQKIWAKQKCWQPDLVRAKKPYYNLMMFPYPSAEGLHIGNVYAFVGSDVWGRYMRLRGYNVFEPIGFDAFGIHSENFAIKQNIHPRDLTARSIDNFRRQLQRTANMYSWDQELTTSDPNYYRWTQWLFLQLYKSGLAYRAASSVSWCPSCKTVLADEQVISNRCERCDSVVETRKMPQWFFKITDYAERLLQNLDKIDWSEHTKRAQRNWIGKSIGWRINFPIFNSQSSVEVFTTRPDTLFGVTYLAVSADHELIENFKDKIENWDDVISYIQEVKNQISEESIRDEKEKRGVELKGISAVNPANQEKIPVWVSDYVLAGYGAGAVMAVPAHDIRDFAFANKYNLPIKQVITVQDGTTDEDEKFEGVYEGEGILINSGSFDGMTSQEAKDAMGSFVKGNKETHYHLRDWLISRQRYWGPPIPIIYCRQCREEQIKSKTIKYKEGVDWTIVDNNEYAVVPVPEKDLPVLLPYVVNFRPTGTGKSPLALQEDFINTKCPQCASSARREADVSDTFLDSSWYYLGYLSNLASKKLKPTRTKRISKNKNMPWNASIVKKWTPVDMYIGGHEHAVLHLMYVRFIAMFLHDKKTLHFEEPFKKFRAHGLLIKDGAKISKSRGNIVNPDEFFDLFGIDTVRMYLMFLSPLEDGGDWHDEGIRGMDRFLHRVWNIVCKNQGMRNKGKEDALERIRHKTIKKVTEDIERLHYNTAISALMEYTNAMSNVKSQLLNVHLKTLLILLAPLAPYITAELWEYVVGKGSVHDQKWPKFDPDFVQEEKIIIPVQINGKVRAEIEVSQDVTDKEIEAAALTNARVQEYLAGQKPQKVIVVRGKLINLVV